MNNTLIAAIAGGVAGAAVMPLAQRFNFTIPLGGLGSWLPAPLQNPMVQTALILGLAGILVGGGFLFKGVTKTHKTIALGMLVGGGVAAAQALLTAYAPSVAGQAVRRNLFAGVPAARSAPTRQAASAPRAGGFARAQYVA